MVQITTLQPSRGELLQESLGQTLGKGISNFLNYYSANKSLESALSDESLKDASPSKRLSALETALRPHGEVGIDLLNKRYAVEQAKQQEENCALQKQKFNEQMAEKRAKKAEEDAEKQNLNDILSKGAQFLNAKDTKGFNSLIESPSTPLEAKAKLLDLKAKNDVENRHKENIQQRKITQVISAYNKKITALQNQMKDLPEKKKAPFMDEINKLNRLKNADIGNLIKDADSFEDLNIWKDIDLIEGFVQPESQAALQSNDPVISELTQAFPSGASNKIDQTTGKEYQWNGSQWVEVK